MKEHGGRFPRDFNEVLALHGIGRYTAGAICSIAFKQPHPILDGNVIRVLCRWFGVEGDPKDKKVNARLWALAGELALQAAAIPDSGTRSTDNGLQNKVSEFNQSLMELGALICLPRQPLCRECPVANVVDPNYTVVTKIRKAYLPRASIYHDAHAELSHGCPA